MFKSTKKRISQLAIAALGAGLISVASVPMANAAEVAANSYNWGTNGGTYSAYTNGSGGICSYSSSTDTLVSINGVGGSTFALGTAGDTIAAANKIVITAVGAGYFNVSSASAGSGEAQIIASNDKKEITLDPNSTDDDALDQIAWVPGAVGKTTITIQQVVVATGITTTLDVLTLQSVATCDGTYNASKSAVKLDTGTLGTGATDLSSASGVTDTVGANSRAYNEAAYISLFLRDQYGAAISDTANYLTATATNGATVSWTKTDVSSSRATDVVTSGLTNEVLAIFGNSSTAAPVTTTVTISLSGTVIATRTITFRGDASKIVISSIRGSITTNSASDVNTTAFRWQIQDSAGNALALNASQYAVTGVVSSVTPGSGSATATTAATVTCSATAGTGSVVLSYTRVSDGATILSEAVPMTCASTTKHTYTASLDKAVYLPGETGTLTIKAVDSGGRPVSDHSDLGTAGTESTIAVGGSGITFLATPLAADSPTSGTWTYKFYTTQTEGKYVVGVTLPTATVATTVDVPFTVKGSSTAVSTNEVLAAIVKLIATINKQIRQLQKQLRR